MRTSLRTRRVLLALSACVAALSFTGTSLAGSIGANDDTGKFTPDGGVVFYQRMAALGLRQAVVTVRWTPSDPLGLPERALLESTVAAAQAAGLRIVFAVYPYPPREIEGGIATPAAFAAWLTALAQSFPQVRQFVVGNEPNQPAFFRPQFVRGRLVSAARFGRFLAAGYDALKAVDPTLTVVGVGLSPRGNDRPAARSNVSSSPVRFLAALGRWYRASGRTRPLMDGFSFHPYPNQATDPLSKGYPWPNAGFVNLDRIKQALFDAFDGTAQPTTVDGLPLYLDEVGWQVDTSTLPGYTGAENVRVTTDQAQATVYGQLVRTALCDPSIAEVNFFGFYDDTLRSGFQAALNRADGTPRSSAEAVREAILSGTCVNAPPAWAPAAGVIGAQDLVRPTADGESWQVQVRSDEGASVVACSISGLPPDDRLRAVLAAGGAGWTCTSGQVVRTTAPLELTVPRLRGPHVVAVLLTAETNASRTTLVTRRLS